MPKVSIITVTLNIVKNGGEGFFKQAFESVHNQTYSNIEHIIIDGGSKDGTVQLIQSLIPTAKKEIKFVSEPDSGIYNAMNKGINLSTGDYIHFLNDSDYYEDSDVVSEVMKVSAENPSDFIIGDVILVHLDGNSTYRSNRNINTYTTFSDWIYHVALFQKRDLFVKYGLFDEKYKIAADNNWLIPLLLDKIITKSYLEKPIARFRLDGISAKEGTKKQTIAELEMVLVKNFKGINNFFRRILQDRAFNEYSSPLIQFLNTKIRKFGLRKIIVNFLIKKKSWQVIYSRKKIINRNNKIVFIGHSYHQKTKSSQFFIDYLSEFYGVETYFDESWNGGQEPDYSSILNSECKAIIFWQIMPSSKIIKTINNQNVIIFPMYDASHKISDFRYLGNIKIINFSATLHKELQKFGFNSYYFQYFPKPKDFCPGKIDEIFFWQRRSGFNVNHVLKILNNTNYKLHIHKAVDPGQKFIPTLSQNTTQITYSDWFDSKDELEKIISEKAIYIASRIREGIGMSFLEAMAMGKVVIANNEPTMNEYIVNGKTGFLCDYKNPTPVNICDVEEIQRNTYKYMQQGYNKWLLDRVRIIEIIESKQCKQKIINCVILSICSLLSLSMYKILKLSKNIRCWFVFDKNKKDRIRWKF